MEDKGNAGRGLQERGKREEPRGEARREHVTEMAGLYGSEKLGRETHELEKCGTGGRV